MSWKGESIDEDVIEDKCPKVAQKNKIDAKHQIAKLSLARSFLPGRLLCHAQAWSESDTVKLFYHTFLTSLGGAAYLGSVTQGVLA